MVCFVIKALLLNNLPLDHKTGVRENVRFKQMKNVQITARAIKPKTRHLYCYNLLCLSLI